MRTIRPGSILGACDILFDDGDFETNVNPEFIRRKEKKTAKSPAKKHDLSGKPVVNVNLYYVTMPVEWRAGDAVKLKMVKPNGRSSYVAGKISSCHKDGRTLLNSITPSPNQLEIFFRNIRCQIGDR